MSTQGVMVIIGGAVVGYLVVSIVMRAMQDMPGPDFGEGPAQGDKKEHKASDNTEE